MNIIQIKLRISIFLVFIFNIFDIFLQKSDINLIKELTEIQENNLLKYLEENVPNLFYLLNYWVNLLDNKLKNDIFSQEMMKDMLRCVFAEQPSSQLFPYELNNNIIDLQKDNNSFFTHLNVIKLKELSSKYKFQNTFLNLKIFTIYKFIIGNLKNQKCVFSNYLSIVDIK